MRRFRVHPIGTAGAVAVAALLNSPARASETDLRQMEREAAAISSAYLRVWSANDSRAVGDVPYIYGPRILFYGRPYSQAQLAAEKRRAIRRWPVRHYEHRPGTMQVLCNERTQKCAARSIIDWDVSNPERGTHARGSSTFDLGVSFAQGRPLILYETGKVIRGGGPGRR